jgi:hypothetical protein
MTERYKHEQNHPQQLPVGDVANSVTNLVARGAFN